MCLLAVCVAGLLLAPSARAEAPNDKEIKEMVAKGYDYLKKSQGEDGSFSPQRAGPGITALVAAALLKNGYAPTDPVVAKALGFIEKNVQKDGGIYNKFLANYTTAVAVMAL
jgi:squalene-hopene/tetraprenyl-beta-curcumene cyclase